MTKDEVNELPKGGKKSGPGRVLKGIGLTVTVLILLCVGMVLFVLLRGGSTLQAKTKSQEPTLSVDGTLYKYNDDIMTFLCMGIDKAGEMRVTYEPADGGQSDAMFLVVLNPDKKQIDVIGINRDTMVDIHCYGYELNGELYVTKAQLSTQHGFGDGRETSARYTMDAVSKLFYDLPLSGYVSISFDAILLLTDSIGGLDVTCLEDLTYIMPEWTEGASIHLGGVDTLGYIRFRDINVFESARGRLARQKQYINAFVEKVVEETKKDITVPAKLYEKIEPYMTTDITWDQVAYLTSRLLDYKFGQVYTLEGETVMGEIYEEFYPDEEKLKELILQVFYEPVG